MSFDYSKAIETAQRLVKHYGRSIQLIRQSGTPADVNKPWLGPSAAAETTKTFWAAFVDPGGASKLGLNIEVTGFVKESAQIAVIATEDDLTVYHKLLDGSRRWTITGQTALRPGSRTILWFVGVGG